jgi:hypothetical protein
MAQKKGSKKKKVDSSGKQVYKGKLATPLAVMR